MKTQRRETSGSTITAGRGHEQGPLAVMGDTYELESLTLCLLLTTKLEAIGEALARVNTDLIPQWTYCLQRLIASCILYLQTVHSSRSTTFFVVFACFPQRAIGQPPAFLLLPGRQHEDAPSCGRRAWSDHRNRTAYGRNDAFPARPTNPCPSCTGSPCGACTTIETRSHLPSTLTARK